MGLLCSLLANIKNCKGAVMADTAWWAGFQVVAIAILFSVAIVVVLLMDSQLVLCIENWLRNLWRNR